jgi:hypothetical protein
MAEYGTMRVKSGLAEMLEGGGEEDADALWVDDEEGASP